MGQNPVDLDENCALLKSTKDSLNQDAIFETTWSLNQDAIFETMHGCIVWDTFDKSFCIEYLRLNNTKKSIAG